MAAAQRTLDRANALLQWYESNLRRLLQGHLPAELISQLDNERARLDKALTQDRRALVCFIGESGIGKSTLLNALVADEKTVVPSGGIGPLTALATEVGHNEIPRFRAEYHPRAHFWRFAAALRFHAARLHAQQAEMPPPDAEAEDVREDLEQEVSRIAAPDGQGGPSRIEEFISTAKLMIAGDQFADRTVDYLADALALAYSMKPQWGTDPWPEDLQRIKRIQDALKLGEQGQAFTVGEGQDQKAFREVLRDHAAGFLSPLIRRIEVGWPSQLLERGLVLVDLPGVGIAGDVYKKETQRFVREKARAIVLVMKRGIAESVMDLLKSTGYWNRLLLSSDDPSADPCSLILAVTHVDELAAEEWRNQDLDAEGRRPKSKQQVFVEVCAKLRDSQKLQLEAQLKAFVQTESGEASRAAREGAAKSLLDSLQVHPLSAVQYRMIAADNEDDPPFLKSLDQTGVPALGENLRVVANDLERRQAETIGVLTRRFAEDLWSQLGLIETSLRRTDRAVEEAKRIRSILETALGEKNSEYKLRRASFRNYLKETVPEKIKSAVLEARIDAEADVRRYLRRLQDEHWATLCAAVRKGGTHIGKRRVDLPDDIAQMFLDPVASVWSQKLLKDIRQQTYKLAADIRQIVEELCDAMAAHGALVNEGFVQTQKKLVSNQVEQLRDVGKEAIEELREVVKVQVVKAIEKPIYNACKKFVDEGRNRGTGVKSRVLEMFGELAARATEGASIPTEKALLSRYETVEAEIRSAFDTWGNPLKTTVEAIVESHEDQTRESESERQHKLADIERVRAEAPDCIEDLLNGLAEVIFVPERGEIGGNAPGAR